MWRFVFQVEEWTGLLWEGVTSSAPPPPFCSVFFPLWFRGRHGAVLIQVSTWLLPPPPAFTACCDNGAGLAHGTEMTGWIILYLNFICRRSRQGNCCSVIGGGCWLQPHNYTAAILCKNNLYKKLNMMRSDILEILYKNKYMKIINDNVVWWSDEWLLTPQSWLFYL